MQKDKITGWLAIPQEEKSEIKIKHLYFFPSELNQSQKINAT